MSYFEWLQNKAGESRELSMVKEKLRKRMVTAYTKCCGDCQKLQSRHEERGICLGCL